VADFDLTAHPNDSYFRSVFADPGHAAAFFQHHLPGEIASSIDWASLTSVPASFVKRSLQQAHADLLFSAVAGGRKVLLYLLFEHQTTVDPAMPLRLLAYVLEILLAHEKEHGLPVPAVIPFVLHQGPETWTVSTRFEDLLDLPEELAAALLPFQPRFTHGLLDLTQFDPAQEEHHAQMRLVLQLMKMARAKRLLEFFQWLAAEGVKPMPITLLRLSLMYALHADARLDVQQIYHTLENNPELRDQTMSIAETLIAQGEARGEAKGRVEGKLQMLQELMGLAVSTAEELQGLDIEELQQRFQELQLRYEGQFKKR
jgi:predicted transposase/invertase (TIGR01784 family)